MVKRTLLAMVLSLAVLFAFQMYLQKQQKRSPGEPKQVEEVKPPVTGELKEPVKEAIPEQPVDVNAFKPKEKEAPRSIKVETPLYKALLRTAGGGFERFDLKQYKDKPGKGGEPVNIIGEGSMKPLPYEVYIGNFTPPLPLNLIFSASKPSLDLVQEEKGTIVLTWKSREGFEIERSYTFHRDSYVVDMVTRYRNGSTNTVEAIPGLELSQVYTEALKGDRYSFKGLVARIGSDVKRFTVQKIFKGKGPQTYANWVAVDSKYFTLGCIPKEPAKVIESTPIGEEGIRTVFSQDKKEIKPGETIVFSTIAYIGPKNSDMLKNVGSGFEEVLDYGFFGWIAKPLVLVLKYSNSVTGNYGIDIIILTIIIKILFHPLTHKSYVSMKKMQDIQPVIKDLQKKYKDDKTRMNQEVMTLYKTYKINPLSGCMPMVLQIPVFFALYKALLVAIELRHAPFMWWIADLSAPEYLYDFNLFGFLVPLRLLPLLMGISMYLQQKMNPSGGMDPTQQKLMNFLPLIFTVMFWGFPSGLVIYWLVNNIISIGQQYYLLKSREKAQPAKKG